MADLYTKEVMDHFTNPRNVGIIKDANGVGETGNPTCGDIMKIYLDIEEVKGKEIINDVKFQTFGCGAAVATSSRITEMVKGMTVEEAEKITNAEVAASLGGLPPVKMHCSNLAANALQAAIKDYRSNK
jgi:nitrogen fixation protein NifU and related proteins